MNAPRRHSVTLLTSTLAIGVAIGTVVLVSAHEGSLRRALQRQLGIGPLAYRPRFSGVGSIDRETQIAS